MKAFDERGETMQSDWKDITDADRTFIVASARSPREAREHAARAPAPIDLVVTSPTPLARGAAAAVVDDRWVFTLEEPLLAPRSPEETGYDVLARLAHALRSVSAYDASTILVVCDSLEGLDGEVFVLDEESIAVAADRLDALVPLP